MRIIFGVFRYHLILLAALSLFLAYFIYALTPVSAEEVLVVEIKINKGDELAPIIDSLERRGIIRSARAFKWYAVLSGGAHLLKPGYYRVTSAEGAVAIFEKFVRGPEDLTVPVIEGATLLDIDSQLGKLGIIPAGSFKNLLPKDFAADYPFLANAKSFEGFLLPDTYRFAIHSDTREVLKKFLDNFRAKALPVLASSPKDIYKNLIIASLIEKEVPDQKNDRALVSGIIARRFAIGMGLQIDATVVYAKCGHRLLTCPSLRLRREDFSDPSPYNTYVHRGLPPTPISNPSISAIIAAMNPKKTDYLFYLSDPKTQRTIFSRDFDEHNDNRAKYLGL
jgi:UPF0755 protein